MFFKDGEEQHENAGSVAAQQAYIEQLRYVNQRIEEAVDFIVAHSRRPPMIIIQGDHGSFFTLPTKITPESLDHFALERLPILNAYLVPEQMRRKLRPDITPVNSFRLLFNECFGEHFDILPEQSFVGWYYGPGLRDVTQLVHLTATRPIGIAEKLNRSDEQPQ